MRNALFTLSVFILGLIGASSQQAPRPTYQNEKAPIPERVKDLLGKMTLEEKVAQLQSGVNMPSFGPSAASLFSKDKLNQATVKQTLGKGLGTYAFLDEFMSMNPGGPKEGAERRNLLQSWVMKNTRLGIPIMFHGEALHGSASWKSPSAFGFRTGHRQLVTVHAKRHGARFAMVIERPR